MNNQEETRAAKSEKKGIHKVLRVFSFVPYLSIVIAIFFGVCGFLGYFFEFWKMKFATAMFSFQFMMLFLIFGVVSRMYYKTIEES